MKAIADQDYPVDGFEVVVVDDGSETPAELCIGSFLDKLNLKIVTQFRSGPAVARNIGAKNARGDFLVFMDDDCAPASDWLQVLSGRFAGSPECAIGGRTINTLTRNAYSTASQILIDYLFAYYNRNPDHARFITSSNLALPTNRFHAIGGYDSVFSRAGGEDRDLCERWLHQGYRVIYAPECRVFHAHELTFSAFLRQHFNYGRGAFYYQVNKSERSRNGFQFEPVQFYLRLLRYPLSLPSGGRAPWLVALLMMSQAANAVGFFWERYHHRR